MLWQRFLVRSDGFIENSGQLGTTLGSVHATIFSSRFPVRYGWIQMILRKAIFGA